MTREPVLGWEKVEDIRGDFFQIRNPIGDGYLYVMCSNITLTWYYTNQNGHRILVDYETPDAAKLACEDHLATLLEPLAKIYDILKENKK